MDDWLSSFTKADFEIFRDRRFGRTNPERMENPFWKAMVRSRCGPYGVSEHFGAEVNFVKPRPVWTFSRIGMSRTVLQDNSMVFIGGEHEDFYDPNFCIYNDVIIKRWDGSVEIFGYPKEAFEPTDFHTATLVEDHIYIIGSIGYSNDRIIGETPIYRLNLETMQIDRLKILGEEPSRLHGHRALFGPSEQAIFVWDGHCFKSDKEIEANWQVWSFSLIDFLWTKVDALSLNWSSHYWNDWYVDSN